MLHSAQIIATLERECRESYKTRKERAAYRAGMSTAFAACDYIASEYGTRTKLHREQAAAAKLCGDMIEGLRAMVAVEDKD